MDKIEITGIPEIYQEDHCCAVIAEVTEDNQDIFVRIQSWNDDKQHPIINNLAGKRIKITIEEIT